MKKAVEQDTLVALIESGAAREFRATRGPGGMELERPAGTLLVAGAFAARADPHLDEPDRAGTVLRDGGHPKFERGVLASVGFGTRK